jgi:hypothetical protein
MTIWWSIFFNLVAMQIRNVIMISLNIQSPSFNELTDYALESTACFFFTHAVMNQAFEWDFLGSMILF